jgi:hypothetical protein
MIDFKTDGAIVESEIAAAATRAAVAALAMARDDAAAATFETRDANERARQLQQERDDAIAAADAAKVALSALPTSATAWQRQKNDLETAAAAAALSALEERGTAAAAAADAAAAATSASNDAAAAAATVTALRSDLREAEAAVRTINLFNQTSFCHFLFAFSFSFATKYILFDLTVTALKVDL